MRFAKHRGLVNCAQLRLYICWYPVYTNALKFYTFNPYSTATNNIGKNYNGPEYRCSIVNCPPRENDPGTVYNIVKCPGDSLQ